MKTLALHFTHPKTNMTMEKITIWKCISHQKQWFSSRPYYFAGEIAWQMVIWAVRICLIPNLQVYFPRWWCQTLKNLSQNGIMLPLCQRENKSIIWCLKPAPRIVMHPMNYNYFGKFPVLGMDPPYHLPKYLCFSRVFCWLRKNTHRIHVQKFPNAPCILHILPHLPKTLAMAASTRLDIWWLLIGLLERCQLPVDLPASLSRLQTSQVMKPMLAEDHILFGWQDVGTRLQTSGFPTVEFVLSTCLDRSKSTGRRQSKLMLAFKVRLAGVFGVALLNPRPLPLFVALPRLVAHIILRQMRRGFWQIIANLRDLWTNP